ncbi:RPL12 [Ecytonucleospora hepatopenaei]|uniref:RPL12 n=1 Tax=Ecytonucleospora hepatopenaei TaxID=646526 RepID=A0A1W0E6D4_9MICR|nr:RPL12 [Ecytonucleospora hepatopenaei]
MVKFPERDPTKDYLVVRVTGGEQPGPIFSQKAGQMKLPGKVVGEDIKKLTVKEYKLQKIHVELAVKDRKAELKLVPTTSQLIVKELKETRQPKKKGGEKIDQIHDGSLSFKGLCNVVDIVHEDRSRSNTPKGTMKQVLGTALAVGCSVEGHNPKDVIKAINGGRSEIATLLNLKEAALPEYLN